MLIKLSKFSTNLHRDLLVFLLVLLEHFASDFNVAIDARFDVHCLQLGIDSKVGLNCFIKYIFTEILLVYFNLNFSALLLAP